MLQFISYFYDNTIFSTKVECSGCCLANDYCIAFSYENSSGKCRLAYTSHANVVYGKNIAHLQGSGLVEVYRDETFLLDTCLKKGVYHYHFNFFH